MTTKWTREQLVAWILGRDCWDGGSLEKHCFYCGGLHKDDHPSWEPAPMVPLAEDGFYHEPECLYVALKCERDLAR